MSEVFKRFNSLKTVVGEWTFKLVHSTFVLTWLASGRFQSPFIEVECGLEKIGLGDLLRARALWYSFLVGILFARFAFVSFADGVVLFECGLFVLLEKKIGTLLEEHFVIVILWRGSTTSSTALLKGFLEVVLFCGCEWHHSSFGLGSNPHPLFIVNVVYPPGRDVL